MCQMQDLFTFSQRNELLAPADALHHFVAYHRTQPMQQPTGYPGHINLPPHMMTNIQPAANGMRTPGIGGPQFASPAHANLALPSNVQMASPHMRGSPAQPTQMAAPAQMVPQHSQQGHNNSGPASSNASPIVTNKRRRPSAIKQEANGDDGSIPEVNGAAKPKVKPSPRIGGKRQKGNPS